MEHPSLAGRSILIVEDEPFIVMDLTQAFEHTGVEVTSTNTLRHALLLVEHDGLSGAILDHALPDGDSSELRRRLNERGIPFLIYSGYRETDSGSGCTAFHEAPKSGCSSEGDAGLDNEARS